MACPVFAVNILPPVIDGTRSRWGGVLDPIGASWWFIGDDVSDSFCEEYALTDGSLLRTVTLADGLGSALDFWGHDGHDGIVYMDGNGDIARWDIGGSSHTVLIASAFGPVNGCFDPEGDRIVIVHDDMYFGAGTTHIEECTMAGVHTVLDSFASLGASVGFYPCVTPDGSVWWAQRHGAPASPSFLARWSGVGSYQSSSLTVQSPLVPRPDNTIWIDHGGFVGATYVPNIEDIDASLTAHAIGCPDLSSVEIARTLVGRTLGASLVAWSLDQAGDGSYYIWKIDGRGGFRVGRVGFGGAGW